MGRKPREHGRRGNRGGGCPSMVAHRLLAQQPAHPGSQGPGCTWTHPNPAQDQPCKGPPQPLHLQQEATAHSDPPEIILEEILLSQSQGCHFLPHSRLLGTQLAHCLVTSLSTLSVPLGSKEWESLVPPTARAGKIRDSRDGPGVGRPPQGVRLLWRDHPGSQITSSVSAPPQNKHLGVRTLADPRVMG